MRANTNWLAALCAIAGIAGIGCTESSSTQVLTGRVNTTGALAVRAIAADSTVTAARVRSDGSFTLALPTGSRYRLEVLTTSGVRHVLSTDGGNLTALSFEICQPKAPWDIGGIGDPGTGTGGGGGGPGCMDPSDPNCQPCIPEDPMCGGTVCSDPMDPDCQPPPPCDPNDPSCTQPPLPCMDPSDPNCTSTPPGCDPTDPMCVPPPECWPGDPSCGTVCTDPTDPNCLPPPPPCMDPTDPYCACDASGTCPPPVCGPNDAMCPPPPPPPCADPTDPETCKDPCMVDPASCGCAIGDPNCWPQPEPPQCDPNGMCEPGSGGMTPDHPPGDFGCEEPIGL